MAVSEVVVLFVVGITSLSCSTFAFVALPLPYCITRKSITINSVPQFPLLLPHQFAKKKSVIVDNNDPESWDQDTPPFYLVRHFARDDVTDDEIKRVLLENFISTVGILVEHTSDVVPLLKKGANTAFCKAVTDAFEKIRRAPEEILGGLTIYDDDCLSKESLEGYSAAAVSVSTTKMLSLKERIREKTFNLVLGSSGSGKTLFALKRLPLLLLGEGETAFLNVHFQVEDAMEWMSDDDDDKLGRTFAEAVAMHVESLIATELLSQKLVGVSAFKLHLHVIIDEAGGDEYSELFDKAPKIRKIVTAIKSKCKYKFESGVHVTIVGTGLDKITSKIKSVVDANKFRMQTWNIINFEAFVEASNQTYKQEVIQAVRDFPILQDLVTNARCAYLLLYSMETLSFLGKSNLRNFVSVLISSVAERYIQSNGLQILGETRDKWAVVRSVFRELDKATRQPGVPFFPQFDDLTGDLSAFRKVAISTLDLHVESSDNILRIVDEKKFAFSMSPALALVVANLLHAEAEVTWDWQGFESNAMLSELKQMVVSSQTIPRRLDNLVLHMPYPLPTSSKSFSLPVVGDATVILNGPLAAYADVIAPFSFVQCKFSSNDSSDQSLLFRTELSQMGLLRDSSKHLLQQYMTQYLYDMWKSGAETPDPVVETTTHSVNKDYRFRYYPFSALNARRISEERKVINGELRIETILVDGKPQRQTYFCADGERISPSLLDRVFDKRRPVFAVFVTNCKAFSLTSMSFTLTPEDVDWTGKLITKVLPTEAVSDLREHVEWRFIFV